MKTKSVHRLAIAVVVAVFCLIFIGGLVTSWQAGMAVPDWPLSFGSLNPDGWWGNFPVRLEHGHRLFAALVGLGVGVLCSAIWNNWRAFGIAIVIPAIAPILGKNLGAEPWMMAHLGVWPAAIGFLLTLVLSKLNEGAAGKVERRLALVAFILVCLQATMGGLRVTRETAGAIDVALVLRVLHGCTAQAFLVILVTLTARLGLSNINSDSPARSGLQAPSSKTAWIAVIAVYLQLILGATMRHLGAGLAIPTFPAASPDGRFMPAIHGLHTDLNFTHTRFGALTVTLLVLWSVWEILSSRPNLPHLRNAAFRSVLLVLLQVALGILVIWHLKPPTLATLHVLVGALLLANLTATLVYLKAAPLNPLPGGSR